MSHELGWGISTFGSEPDLLAKDIARFKRNLDDNQVITSTHGSSYLFSVQTTPDMERVVLYAFLILKETDKRLIIQTLQGPRPIAKPPIDYLDTKLKYQYTIEGAFSAFMVRQRIRATHVRDTLTRIRRVILGVEFNDHSLSGIERLQVIADKADATRRDQLIAQLMIDPEFLEGKTDQPFIGYTLTPDPLV